MLLCNLILCVCVCLHINPELNRKEVSNKQYISAAFDL